MQGGSTSYFDCQARSTDQVEIDGQQRPRRLHRQYIEQRWVRGWLYWLLQISLRSTRKESSFPNWERKIYFEFYARRLFGQAGIVGLHVSRGYQFLECYSCALFGNCGIPSRVFQWVLTHFERKSNSRCYVVQESNARISCWLKKEIVEEWIKWSSKSI